MAKPDPAPTGMADFRLRTALECGPPVPLSNLIEIAVSSHPIDLSSSWPLTIDPVMGAVPFFLAHPAGQVESVIFFSQHNRPVLSPLACRLPFLELTPDRPADLIPPAIRPDAIPQLFDRWFAGPAPQAAERMVFSTAMLSQAFQSLGLRLPGTDFAFSDRVVLPTAGARLAPSTAANATASLTANPTAQTQNQRVAAGPPMPAASPMRRLGLQGALPGPAAEAVARLAFPRTKLEQVSESGDVVQPIRLPELAVSAIEYLDVPKACESIATASQVAERSAAPFERPAEIPTRGIQLPALGVALVDYLDHLAILDSHMAGLSAEIAERMVAPVGSASIALPAVQLPALALEPADYLEIPAPCEVSMRGPMAEAAEREVQPVAAEAMAASIAARQPELSLEALEDLQIPLACEEPMRRPAAEPAERLLVASAAAAPVSTLRTPVLEIAAVHYLGTPALCESWMRGPQAEAAEREVVAASAVAAKTSEIVFRQPELAIAAVEDMDSTVAYDHPMQGPAAEAAEREVVPAVAATAWMAAVQGPQFQIAAIGYLDTPAACEEPAAAPAAQAAEREMVAAHSLAIRTGMSLPVFGLTGTDGLGIPTQSEVFQPSLAAELVAREVISTQAPSMAAQLAPMMPMLASLGPAAPQVRLPLAPTAAIRSVGIAGPVQPAPSSALNADLGNKVVQLPRIEATKPTPMVPAAGPSSIVLGAQASDPRTNVRVERAESGGVRMPQLPGVSAEPGVGAGCTDWMPLPSAEPAERMAIPSSALQQIVPQQRFPNPVPAGAMRTYIPDSARWRRTEPSQPAVVSVWPRYLEFAAWLRLPDIACLTPVLYSTEDLLPRKLAGPVVLPRVRPVESMRWTKAAEPAAMQSRAAVALPALKLAVTEMERVAATETAPVMEARSVEPRPTRMAGFRKAEVFCDRPVGLRQIRNEWWSPEIDTAMPNLLLRVIPQSAETPVTKPAPRKPEAAEPVPAIPPAKRQPLAPLFIKMAACLLLGISLWVGSKSLVGPRRISLPGGGTASAGSAGSVPAQPGAFSRFRGAIARRAAAESGDTLRAGMGNWGAAANAYAPGWSRDAAGFVRTGQMALFKPSMNYVDYRLEFFGQIEDRGMNWAMRAKDSQNYYAMKFTMVSGGLRPVVSMAHYPVIGGRAGHRVEFPLNVMLHYNTPYHVAVDVVGNRFTAFLEGEQIDSWTDDAPKSGGVGFFAEAGERARLYWMKVSTNQDLLGRICAYLSVASRDGGGDSAEVWGPELPPNTPAPPVPAPTKEVTLAAAQGQWARASQRRNQVWNL